MSSTVTTIASQIGNWGRPLTSALDRDIDEFYRLAEQMHELGSKFLRVMSHPNEGLEKERWRSEALKRLGILAELAARESIILVHENCSGWVGPSVDNTLEML